MVKFSNIVFSSSVQSRTWARICAERTSASSISLPVWLEKKSTREMFNESQRRSMVAIVGFFWFLSSNPKYVVEISDRKASCSWLRSHFTRNSRMRPPMSYVVFVFIFSVYSIDMDSSINYNYSYIITIVNS